MRTVHQKTLKGILCIVVIFLFVYVAKYEVLKYHIQESALASEPTELRKSWVSSSTPVRFWIDMPNKFPWRHCLQDYNGVLTTLNCEKERETQQFNIISIIGSAGFQNFNFNYFSQ